MFLSHASIYNPHLCARRITNFILCVCARAPAEKDTLFPPKLTKRCNAEIVSRPAFFSCHTHALTHSGANSAVTTMREKKKRCSINSGPVTADNFIKGEEMRPDLKFTTSFPDNLFFLEFFLHFFWALGKVLPPARERGDAFIAWCSH